MFRLLRGVVVFCIKLPDSSDTKVLALSLLHFYHHCYCHRHIPCKNAKINVCIRKNLYGEMEKCTNMWLSHSHVKLEAFEWNTGHQSFQPNPTTLSAISKQYFITKFLTLSNWVFKCNTYRIYGACKLVE